MALVSYNSGKKVWPLACVYVGNAPVSDQERHVVRWQ
jgi:hypothetical protein